MYPDVLKYLNIKNHFKIYHLETLKTSLFNSLTTKKQRTKFRLQILKKMLSPSYIILRIQRLECKQCRSRWGGSHQDLCCLQIQLFSSLVVKELIKRTVFSWNIWIWWCHFFKYGIRQKKQPILHLTPKWHDATSVPAWEIQYSLHNCSFTPMCMFHMIYAWKETIYIIFKTYKKIMQYLRCIPCVRKCETQSSNVITLDHSAKH